MIITHYHFNMLATAVVSLFTFLPVLLIVVVVTATRTGECSYSATCTANGVEGVCVNVSSGCCTGSATTNLCLGDKDIQCCTLNTCSTPSGDGVCEQTSLCNSQGSTSISGYCSGPSDLQCCIPELKVCKGTGLPLLPNSYLYTLSNQGFPGHPGALVYFPTTFDSTNVSKNLEVVIWVHGYNNCIVNIVRKQEDACNCSTGEGIREAYDLIGQFERAAVYTMKSNRIFVAIEVAYDEANDDPGRWAEPNLFHNFMQELLEIHLSSESTGVGVPLALADVTRVQIFSHSGGYFTIGNIAAVGGMPDEVRDLILLDSLYADFQHFDDYVQSHLSVFGTGISDYRFTSVYTATGGTYDNNINMEKRSENWIATNPNSAATLLDDMNLQIPLLSVDQLLKYSLIYKLSSYSHDDVARNYLYQVMVGTA